MIITPWSANDLYTSGGQYEPTVANFPCVKHFFNRSCISGITLVDAFGGITVTPTSLADDSANNRFNADQQGTASTIDAGTVASIGTKDAMLVVSGHLTATNLMSVGFGNVSDGVGVTVANNSAGSAASSFCPAGTNVPITALSAATAATDYIWVATFDRSGNANTYRYVLTSGTADSTSGNVDISASVAVSMDLTEQFALRGKFYGAMLLTFTNGLPTDALKSALWMASEWKNGRYRVSPSLYGVA